MNRRQRLLAQISGAGLFFGQEIVDLDLELRITRMTQINKNDIFRRMKQFTLEFWKDDGWYVGRLKEMPAVMSQAETLEGLQVMIREAYQLMLEDATENAFVPEERQELAISL